MSTPSLPRVAGKGSVLVAVTTIYAWMRVRLSTVLCLDFRVVSHGILLRVVSHGILLVTGTKSRLEFAGFVSSSVSGLCDPLVESISMSPDFTHLGSGCVGTLFI